VGQFYPVCLIRASTAIEFIVQFLSEKTHDIDEVIRPATPPIARTLTKNEFVCVVHGGARYRGCVEKPDDMGRIRDRLIDFGAVFDVAVTELYDLPQRLESIPAQAATLRLAFVSLVRDESEDRSWVWQTYKDSALYLHPLSIDDTPQVVLYNRPSVNGESLNCVIVEEADVKFSDVDFDLGDEYLPLVDALRQLAADRNLEVDFDDD
jgi:hypothetical protein